MKLADEGEKISDASFSEELDEEVGRSRAKYDPLVRPDDLKDTDFRIGRMPYDHKQLDRDARAILKYLGIDIWNKRDEANHGAVTVSPYEAHELSKRLKNWRQITIYEPQFVEAAEEVLNYDGQYWEDAASCIWEYLWLAGFKMMARKKNKALEEDTEKQGTSWVNKGEEGTHGKFKTKKEADAQRKAMFANGFKG